MTAAEIARTRGMKLAQLICAAREWRAALKSNSFEAQTEAELCLGRAVDEYSSTRDLPDPKDPDQEHRRKAKFVVFSMFGLLIAIALHGCGGAAAVDVAGAPLDPVTVASCRELLCPGAADVEIIFDAPEADPDAGVPICQCRCGAELVQWITTWPPTPAYVAAARANWDRFCPGGDQ